MKIELPLQVLGLLAPILSWVEASEEVWLPGREHRRPFGLEGRQRAWLRRELPTYSRDTLDEIGDLVRETALRTLKAASPPPWWIVRSTGPEPVSPRWDYNLIAVFDKLSERYFEWTGNKLRVRVGRLEELHELGARFPVTHLIRHAHARAVSRGFLGLSRAEELPAQLSALHTASRSLRAVVERGLSEGHLHLWGVTSADEVWADHLLSRPASGVLRKLSSPERRLLDLGRFAVGCVAFGVAMAMQRDHLLEGWARLNEIMKARTEEPEAVKGEAPKADPSPAARLGERHSDPSRRQRCPLNWIPFHLLDLLDGVYRAHHPAKLRRASSELRRRFHRVTRDLLESSRLAGGGDGDLQSCQQILYRLDPALFPLIGSGHGFTALHGEQRTGIRERTRWLEGMHLEVQLQLLELSELIERAHEDELKLNDPFYELLCGLYGFLHQAFFRYLVFHTHHLQLATQQGRTTGLREFKQFYGARQRTFLSPEIAQQQSMILDRLLEVESLKLVEGRLSPPARGVHDLEPWILYYANRSSKRRPGFGIIIHFLKQSTEETRQSRADERAFPIPRQGRFRDSVRREAFRLFRLLTRPHAIVPFVVGIDAANEELTTPPEIFAPAFRFLLDFPIEVRSTTGSVTRLGCEEEILRLLENRRLGLTYHVGEDFRHLLSGLRAIYEAIEFLHMRPGDRLGHALALALDPEVWATQVGFQAVLSKQEWLDTLVWLHHLLGPGHNAAGALGLEDRIQHLSEEIYRTAGTEENPRRFPNGPDGPSLSVLHRIEGRAPLTLHDAWKLRQLDPFLISFDALHDRKDPFPADVPIRSDARRWLEVQREIFRQIKKDVHSWATYELLRCYWFNRECWRTGRETLVVDMQQEKDKDLWLQVCRDAQVKMKELVRWRQLVVEVNPTSNRRIGPMSSLAEHPIFDLTLDTEGCLSREVITTINTDDPGVFNTSLAHEYYLLGEILLRRGLPEGEVMNWLEWLRLNGHEYSFARFLPELETDKILNQVSQAPGPVTDWLTSTRKIRLAPAGAGELPGVSRPTGSSPPDH